MKNGLIPKVGIAIGLAVLVAADGQSATHNWDAGGGADQAWSTPANWTPESVPLASEIAIIGNTAAGSSADATAVVSVASASCSKLYMGHTAAHTKGRLCINGGDVTATDASYIGNYGLGHVTQTDGTATFQKDMTLGMLASATGIYEMANGSLFLTNGILYCGNSGRGFFIQTGGTNTLKYLYLSSNADGTGSYTLNGSARLDVRTASYVGLYGSGAFFSQTGGVHTTATLTIGNYAFGEGQYDLADGWLDVSAGNATLGMNGKGLLNQTGGSNTVLAASTYMSIAHAAGSEGIYNLAGGALFCRGLRVGRQGAGTLNLGDATRTGAISATGAVEVRYFAEASGTLRGWGVVDTPKVMNNGRVIADGYGMERILDFSTAKVVSNIVANTTDNGWFATNHGQLALGSLAVVNGANFWGEVNNLDLVNSVKLELDGTSGNLSGALLATDHADVPAGLYKPVSVWAFTGADYTSAAVTIRYDDAAAAALHLDENDLKLLQFDGSSWRHRACVVDATAKTISANLSSPIGMIAVAAAQSGTVLLAR